MGAISAERGKKILDFLLDFCTVGETNGENWMKTIMTYTFGLFDSHDQLIDQTNIDENNLDFAWQLFVEFSPNESYKDILSETAQYHVELLEEVPEEVDDDYED